MHENENWIVWNPMNIEGGSASYVEIVQEEKAYRFTLECNSRVIDILFYGHVPIYVYSDESIRMATWASVQEKNHDRYCFQKWFLYKVMNSNFMDWAIKESCGFYQEEELFHFCIVTETDVVDILSTTEPEIVVRKMTENPD